MHIHVTTLVNICTSTDKCGEVNTGYVRRMTLEGRKGKEKEKIQ